MNTENICCFICKRAIYKHFKIIMPVNKAFCFYLSDKIQHLLRSSHCKRGNYHITAPVKGLLNDICQKAHIIWSLSVAPVSVCGFHYHVVCFTKIGRVFYKRLIFVSYISGKYNSFFNSSLTDIHLNTA